MKDKKVQQGFFDTVVQKKASSKNALKLYQALVFHRFNEVLSNANPILTSLVKKKRFEKMVKAFMKSGAHTDLIWQLPKEFRKFVKKNPKAFSDVPYIKDLLWFEYIEVELIMQDYSQQEPSAFDWNHSYELSSLARIKKLKYNVYAKEFTQKGKYPVLVYYDLVLKQVIYREISAFMYEYLKLLKEYNIKTALKTISNKYKLKNKEVKALLEKPLKELCALGVLTIKDT